MEALRRRREVDGVGVPRNVGVAPSVHGDTVVPIVVAASEVGGVAERWWVDHEGLAPVVVADLKADLMGGLPDEPAGDVTSPSIGLLVKEGLLLSDNGAAREVEHEVALGGDVERLRAVEIEPDGAGVGPGVY